MIVQERHDALEYRFGAFLLSDLIEPLLKPPGIAIHKAGYGLAGSHGGPRRAVLALSRPFLAFAKAAAICHRLILPSLTMRA